MLHKLNINIIVHTYVIFKQIDSLFGFIYLGDKSDSFLDYASFHHGIFPSGDVVLAPFWAPTVSSGAAGSVF